MIYETSIPNVSWEYLFIWALGDQTSKVLLVLYTTYLAKIGNNFVLSSELPLHVVRFTLILMLAKFAFI